MTSGLYTDAVDVLHRWTAPTPDQERLRREFLHHLASRPDGLWRTCRPAHITASALVVDPARRRVLLTLHARAGVWCQTGGHCEPTDSSLAAAALRESTEESGLTGLEITGPPVRLDRHPAPCQPGLVEHHLDVQYLAVARSAGLPRATAESRDLQWFPWSELPEPTDQAVRALARLASMLGRQAVIGQQQR